MHECSIAAHAICVRTTMPSLCSVLNFLRSRLTRKHNASFSYVLDRVASIRVQKYKKSVICHSTITDFILIYSCIPLFCLGFGIPIASLNSFIFFMNQLICDTPSILKSNFPFSSSLMEPTARWVAKPWLNSEECSLPFMGTSLNVHNLRIISSLKPKRSRRKFIVGISFSTYGK